MNGIHRTQPRHTTDGQMSGTDLAELANFVLKPLGAGASAMELLFPPVAVPAAMGIGTLQVVVGAAELAGATMLKLKGDSGADRLAKDGLETVVLGLTTAIPLVGTLTNLVAAERDVRRAKAEADRGLDMVLHGGPKIFSS